MFYVFRKVDTSRIMESHNELQASHKADVIRLFSVLHVFTETHKTNTKASESL